MNYELFRNFVPVKAQFLIAAPMSGSGKTTLARGLMALLTQKGMKVQPFKCGPDYIDTKFHEAVCGRPSINLDTFMATEQHVRDIYARYADGADVCVVEGMMGLFDGYDRDKGSTSEIARTLDLPIVLVVDARSAAYSMAALLSGFLHFRNDLRFAGVIYNKVGSERHYQMLRQVCDDLGVRCLGYLPKQKDLEQGSRYLGLDFSESAESHLLTTLLETHVDWKALLTLSLHGANDPFARGKRPFCTGQTNREPGVVVACNAESFSFLYQEMLDSFGSVTFFDPETEVPDLSHANLLYLPGGYPEKHVEALVGNEACRQAIRRFAEQGGRVMAECGGMMYLCQTITTDDGEWPMCGVLPYKITARSSERRLSLGYRRFTLDGREYRGHEFHYTQFLGDVPKSIVQVYNAKGEPVTTPVFKYQNVLASYTHLYLCND